MSKRRCPSELAFLAALLLLAAWAQADGPSDVADTPHNLSASGPGPIKVAGTTGVCIFCHTPHAANPIAPLWNRQNPGTYYKTYESSTMIAHVGQPSGSSRLCLSCHDGTIALNQTYNPRSNSSGSVYIEPGDKGYIGTDLSNDHPISFVYNSALALRDGQLRDPNNLPRQLELDENGELQCTTCHDPHDDRYGDFLRMDNMDSAMCQSCHEIRGWASSSHATSSALLAKSKRDRWTNIHATTVKQAACESCHRPHDAGGPERLMRHEAEEDNCLSCHDGTVAKKDISAELAKPYAHDVTLTTGVHQPNENPATMPPHVECSDCHNPHEASAGPPSHAPYIQPAMRGVSGVNSAGNLIPEAAYEYQVCFKCHSSRDPVRTQTVPRVIPDTNIAEQFSPANPSYHPVEAPGRDANVPSLRPPLTTGSMIYCTDCHNSDDSATGASGPHGSIYPPLLVRNYDTTDGTHESPQAYALCYGCHSRSSILSDQSFSGHREHVVDQNTPCSVCHDAHGVSIAQAGGSGGEHLINFDRRVVKPSPSTGTGPTYQSLGTFRGSCTLYCHGKDHVNATYPN